MKLRHSRKRDKIYLKKLYFLRNFLNLLQLYRAYLGWKFQKRPKAALDWRPRHSVEWKNVCVKVTWSPFYKQPKIYTTVIFRYYQCQLTMTFLINSPRLFSFIAPIDKTFHIFYGRETERRNLFTACEFVDEIARFDYDKNILGIRRFRGHLWRRLTIFHVPGQTLMNWMAQSLQTIDGSVTSSLNENDLSLLTLQYCTNLLSAGVIRQLDTATPGSESFKVSSRRHSYFNQSETFFLAESYVSMDTQGTASSSSNDTWKVGNRNGMAARSWEENKSQKPGRRIENTEAYVVNSESSNPTCQQSSDYARPVTVAADLAQWNRDWPQQSEWAEDQDGKVRNYSRNVPAHKKLPKWILNALVRIKFK